jgi:hypothetical protein
MFGPAPSFTTNVMTHSLGSGPGLLTCSEEQAPGRPCEMSARWVNFEEAPKKENASGQSACGHGTTIARAWMALSVVGK